jgi:hypothetical protein
VVTERGGGWGEEEEGRGGEREREGGRGMERLGGKYEHTHCGMKRGVDFAHVAALSHVDPQAAAHELDAVGLRITRRLVSDICCGE